MAYLQDLIITEDELAKYGITTTRLELNDDATIDELINEAWEELISFIFVANDDISSSDDIIILLDTADKIGGFKFAQQKVIVNLASISDNPITQDVVLVLQGRCKLVKKNGWQKNFV